MKATATATATPKKNRKRMNEQMKITRTQQQTLLPLMDTAPGADTKKIVQQRQLWKFQGKSLQKPNEFDLQSHYQLTLFAHKLSRWIFAQSHIFFCLFGVCEFYS